MSNGYIVGWDSGHYIGRGGKGKKGSAVMAELFYLKEQAIIKDINLLCFCKQPTREVACHGDVIKSCLEWMIK